MKTELQFKNEAAQSHGFTDWFNVENAESECTQSEQKVTVLNTALKNTLLASDNLKTVMIAAAEEIMRVWPAHCDTEGYGPSNLLRRLEQGIPSQYGYTAGAFEKQDNKIAELKKELASILDAFSEIGEVSMLPTEIKRLKALL